MRQRFFSFLSRRAILCVRLLPVAALGLMVFASSDISLAAPNPAATTALPAAAQIQSLPLSQTPPTCKTDDTANKCAQEITGALSGTVQAVYQIGIWAVVVVGILVIIWTTPSAIMGVATNNSKVIGQLVLRIGIIGALILLAINSWTILQWFVGSAGTNISPPDLPTIQQ